MKVKSELLKRAYEVRTKDEIRDLYKDWAESYDQDMVNELDYVGPDNIAQLLASHLTDKTTKILDVGCGTGLVGEGLASRGFTETEGLDLSAEMLRVAGRKGVYRALHEGDLLGRLPLADDGFGAAISAGTFTEGHVGPEGLNEVIRVVAPGGLICISVNDRVYESHGYGAALVGLTSKKICEVVEQTEIPYVLAEDIGARAIVLRIC